MNAGKFEVIKNYYSGRYFWRLKDDTGRLVVQSDGYASKRKCVDAINLIKQIAPTSPIIDLVTELITA